MGLGYLVSSTHFSTHFTFRIDTRNKKYYSEGFAFFLAPVGYPIPPNSAGSVLGLFNSTTALSHNQIVTVEFDTFHDEWDPPAPHVGINVNNISLAVTSNWDFNNTKVAKAWITYNATTKNLSVLWTDEETPSPSATTLSYQIESPDICQNGLLVNRQISKNIEGHEYYLKAVVPSITRDLERLALPRRFAYRELVVATIRFANDRRLGQGGSGDVYRGVIPDLGCVVAVKRIFAESEHYEKIFINEVKIISQLIHKNLVQFIGWCHEQGECLLVYAYMPNSSLDNHLFGVVPASKSFSWVYRYRILSHTCSWIEYLHTGCVPAIIHKDLKSSNILIEKNMRAKVSDFGLSKLAVDGASHVSSIVRGTVGYLDPEYYISLKLTDKSDVYSFGVILLELISGQEAISNENFGVNCRNIVQWAKLHIESGDIQGIIDPSLHGEYDIQSMWKIAEKALMCVQAHGYMRPSISEVLKEIQDAILMERGAAAARDGNSDDTSKNSVHSSLNLGSLDLGGADNYLSLDESIVRPTAR
ncbi:PREDICTED: L-type lectin-domain containing receptor kinase IX.1-like [Fragaria vesca subsp. vesca]